MYRFLGSIARYLRSFAKQIPSARNRRDIEQRHEDRLESMVGPPGVWRQSRVFQIEFLKDRGLMPEHRLLDIGCGPLRGGIPLIDYLDSRRYTGVDIRPAVIEEARREVAREGLHDKSPELLTSLTFGAELPESSFDFVWCFQVLYHLEDDLASACLASIARRLERTGVCYANVNLVGDEGRWQEFPYLRRPLEFYQSIAKENSLSLVNLGQQIELGFKAPVPGRYNHMLEFRPAA